MKEIGGGESTSAGAWPTGGTAMKKYLNVRLGGN
jgi:hypothetical protein